MSVPSSHFHQSLHDIHRRWIFIRTIERIALCILIACAIATILSLILISRGESALPLILICLSAGLLCGALVGWLMRPSLFDTAVEVDHQLHLADLLATALSIQKQQTVSADSLDQQWAGTIIALAEARCASITGEQLMLRRFGAGTWGGVGLFTALVLTLGVLSTNPLLPQALGFSAASSDTTQLPNQTRDIAHRSHRINDPEDSPDAESRDRSRMEAEIDSSSHQDSGNGDSEKNSLAAQDHAGADSGRTPNAITANQIINGASNAGSSQTGMLANGGGRASEAGRGGENDSASTVGLSQNHRTAPWTSNTWPAAQNRAGEEIRTGQIPDAYRDLVHDYFNRDSH